MNQYLTREDILALDDLTIEERTIPEHIPAWGGKKVFIKQLSRGQQNTYLKRLRGGASFKQNKRSSQSEVVGVTVDGHDSWLVVRGCCDEKGVPLFTDKDEALLDGKNGEAIGWLASEIQKFSGMAEDAKVASGEKTTEEATADELKA